MCEICIKIFNKSKNRSIAQKSRGAGNVFFYREGWVLRGGWENFAVQGVAEPLGGAEISIETMMYA